MRGFDITFCFRAFSHGTHANKLGLFLTLVLPLVTALLAQSDWRMLAILLPPGGVYFGSTESPSLWSMIGPLSAGVVSMLFARRAIFQCERDLRHWCEQNHGINIVN